MSPDAWRPSARSGHRNACCSRPHRARRITTNELFASAGTDALGSYLIDGAPAGIYAVDIINNSRRFVVEERFDVRVSSYLLEACFELDSQSQTASLLREPCSSGLYAERHTSATHF